MVLKDVLDLEDISNQFYSFYQNAYLYKSYRDSITKEGIYQNLLIWAKNKQSLFEFFGEKLIIEKEIEDLTFAYNEEQEEFVRKSISDFKRKIQELCEPSIYLDIVWFLDFCVGANGFSENFVTNNFNKYGIKKGTKFSKSLKKIIRNQKLLMKIQDIYSNILQKDIKNIYGKIYLSIHPLDFLTMSHNLESWSSCYAIDSDYSASIFELMNDSETAVSYILTKDKKVKYGDSDLIWNTKKWRKNVHFFNVNNNNEYFIYYNTEYPYKSKRLEENLSLLLKSNLNLSLNKIEGYDYLRYSKDYLGFREPIQDSFYETSSNITRKIEGFLEIGSKDGVLCLSCGKHMVESDSQFILCDRHLYEIGDRCSHCETLILNDDINYYINDKPICDHCAGNYSNCDVCGELIYDSTYVNNDGLCDFCLLELIEKNKKNKCEIEMYD